MLILIMFATSTGYRLLRTASVSSRTHLTTLSTEIETIFTYDAYYTRICTFSIISIVFHDPRPDDCVVLHSIATGGRFSVRIAT